MAALTASRNTIRRGDYFFTDQCGLKTNLVIFRIGARFSRAAPLTVVDVSAGTRKPAISRGFAFLGASHVLPRLFSPQHFHT